MTKRKKKIKKRPSYKTIAEATGVTLDTIFRIKSGRNNPSVALAKRLEQFLKIDRRRFLYPDEFGDPWKVLEERYERHA